MTRLAVLLALVLTVACAPKAGYAPIPTFAKIVSAYLAAERPTLVCDEDGGRVIVRTANAKALVFPVEAAVCADGDLWVKAQAAVPKPEAAK